MNTLYANERLERVIKLDDAIELAIKNLEMELDEQGMNSYPEISIPFNVVVVNENGERLFSGDAKEVGEFKSVMQENNLLLEVGGVRYFLAEKK
jgi:hypothetical protein